MPQERDLAVRLRVVAIAGLWVSHVHDAFEESASKDAFALHCNKRNLTISRSKSLYYTLS